MQEHSKNPAEAAPCGRILFTGNGHRVIDDLMSHTPGKHELKKCAPTDTELLPVLDAFFPHAIVVCLANEPMAVLHLFSSLQEDPLHSSLPILVIGNEEDCADFTGAVFQEELKVFPRPLDRKSYEEALQTYVHQGIALDEAVRQRAQEEESVDQEAVKQQELLAAEDALVKKIERMNREYGKKTILVVDDDVRMLNVIRLYLQELYDIIMVPSGKLALKYLAKKSADLVLLDYMMPVEDGPAVLKQIREDSPQPQIPVVFLTGVSDKDLVMRGLELRPNGYLLKPVTRETLLEKTTEILLGIS